MSPTTVDRVSRHTPADTNAQIRNQTRDQLVYYAEHPDQIDRRLAELDREWDIERTLEANAASFALGGTLMAFLTGHRRWLVLPGVVTGFLLQHAIQGWCPPLTLFRRLGVRTQSEIESERYALKALRGDFKGVTAGPGEPLARASEAFDAVFAD